MIFYIRKNQWDVFEPDELPSCVLTMERWDDFSTKSKFCLFYYGYYGSINDIGEVKILKKNTSTTINILDNDYLETILPDNFYQLENDCISLGQDLSYYKNLRDICGEPIAIEILTALRDISWRPPLAAPF